MSNRRQRFLLLLALVLLTAAIWLLARQYRVPVQQMQNPAYDALADLAANATAKLLNNQGRVFVIQFDSSFAGIPRLDNQIAAFRQALRQRGLTDAGYEQLPIKRSDTTLGARLTTILRKQTGVDAVVLFGAAYGLSMPDLPQLPPPRPKLISVLAFDAQLKKLFQANLVQLAILPPGFLNATTNAPLPAFEVVTPETADRLLDVIEPQETTR